MSVVQGIQTKQFAFEQRRTTADDHSSHRARVTLAALASRRGDDVHHELREVLDALGLLDTPTPSTQVAAVSS